MAGGLQLPPGPVGVGICPDGHPVDAKTSDSEGESLSYGYEPVLVAEGSKNGRSNPRQPS